MPQTNAEANVHVHCNLNGGAKRKKEHYKSFGRRRWREYRNDVTRFVLTASINRFIFAYKTHTQTLIYCKNG